MYRLKRKGLWCGIGTLAVGGIACFYGQWWIGVPTLLTGLGSAITALMGRKDVGYE